MATVVVSIDGLGEGDAGWVRAAEAEKTGSGSFHYPEFSTTNTVYGRKDGKTIWHTMTWADWLGKDRRLRVQAGGFTCPVVVTPYSCKIHGWKS